MTVHRLIRPVFIAAILLLQIAGALFFLYDMLSALLGLPPLDWTLHELLEVAAAAALVIGSVLGGLLLRGTLRRNRAVEAQLRAASGAFLELMEERFAEWGLTQAERDVALFAMKGFSIGEIAAMRATSEGTVKAQTAAIYRKAGVSSRPQLLSLFIDELMGDALVPSRSQPSASAQSVNTSSGTTSSALK